MKALFVAMTLLFAVPASAGILDPDCTPEKAMQHAASKAVLGFSTNRCTWKETSQDMLGLDDKKKKDEGNGVFNLKPRQDGESSTRQDKD